MMQGAALQGRRILVIEDEFLIAESLSEVLSDAGAVVLGPIGWRDEALAYIRQDHFRCDGAVLDVTLHGQLSYPIADALAASGIPFVFVTGYDSGTLAAAYRGYPRCDKPLQAQAVVAALLLQGT